MISPISWLHVSDFHFRAEGDRFSQEQAANALLESIRDVVDPDDGPQFAVVTGDIAYSGQAAEYSEASLFLDELVASTGIDPSDFYFVPGNHDVDRNIQDLAYYGGRARINSPERVDRYLGNSVDMAPLKDRQAAFWSFVDGFTTGQQRVMTADGLGYVAKVELHPLTICLLGLNSAWLRLA